MGQAPQVLASTIDSSNPQTNVSVARNSTLNEQELLREFSGFIEQIETLSQAGWREILPFIELASPTRNLISIRGHVIPSLIYMSDFIEVGKPFFYSRDNIGRPFIAFVINQKGILRIKTIFFSTLSYNLNRAFKEHFRAIADLFFTGMCVIDTGKGKVLWSLAKMHDIEEFYKKLILSQSSG